MTIDKAYLEQKLRSLQEQAHTLQANLEALSGAIQMTRLLLADLERPEVAAAPKGPQLVPPMNSITVPADMTPVFYSGTTDLVPAVEGEP